MAEFASNGKGNLGVTLGAIGTAGALMGNGGLGNLFNVNGGGCCSENTPATRYDIEQSERLSEKDMEIATLRATQASEHYTQAAVVDLSDRLMKRFEALNDRFCQNEKEQAVFNGTTTATMSCLSGQVNNMQSVLNGLTKTVIPSSNVCNQDYQVVVTNTACNPVYTQVAK